MAYLGLFFKTFWQVLSLVFQGKIEKHEFLIQAKRVACDALIPVLVINTALGVVIAVQLAPQFADQGLGSNMGILAAASLTREVGPIMGAMMIATQYGTGTAAELANMKITEQVDALKVFKVDPAYYLIVPRFLAATIFAPIIILLAVLAGIASTYIFSWLLEDIALNGFLGTIQAYLKIGDIYLCIFKSIVFSALIIVISSMLGLSTRGGAAEVGKITTLTVIINFITVVIVDYIISAIYL